MVNQIREDVARWRDSGFEGVTPITRELLRHWASPDRRRRLFFCQLEAAQTVIYLAEILRSGRRPRFNPVFPTTDLARLVDTPHKADLLPLTRFGCKMATGSGKTVVMAMLIAWAFCNRGRNPSDERFPNAVLVCCPNLTVKERLQVLRPEHDQNYYAEFDIVPARVRPLMQNGKVLVENWHRFAPESEHHESGKSYTVVNKGAESPEAFARRILGDLYDRMPIMVLNDEAHHCYRRKPDGEDDKLTGDDRVEAKQREEEARIWISGIEAVKEKIGVKAIYDLSATPFFLRGSGYPEGTLFPWVVSDFSLIDAIEAGIVKVPRVPVADDSMTGEQPTYRDLWIRIRDELPKKGRKTDAIGGEPKLPVALQGALHSLYSNYEKSYRRWEAGEKEREGGTTPPVFIVVCNNTNVSKMVFDYIAGWEKPFGDEMRVQKGELEIFRNDDGEGRWLDRPNTILVDSQQLESGGAMSDDFKKIAAREIEEFKDEYRRRFPGRDAEELTDEDLLREVMNTVGKKGRLGEHVRCVVSVSMLTEGWDANTVTHILGVRAFGTQLLCEQVVGRALRRMSYTANDEGHFEPEYAEVYGVPFSFIPSTGNGATVKPGPMPTRVRALDSRIDAEITFPRLLGYRYELPDGPLRAEFTEESHLALDTRDIPSWTEVSPIIGVSDRHSMYDVERRRPNEVAFHLAVRVLRYLRDAEENDKPWLFPQILEITKRWMRECVTLKDNAIIQMLVMNEYENDAADRIYHSIVNTNAGTKRLRPILRPYDTLGSTRYVDYDTTKPVWPTDPDKCHVTHVVADTESWEQKTAQAIQEMPEVIRYVKNDNLGFRIPYTLNGSERDYIPDFIACIDDGHGLDDLLNLIIEVTGEKKKDKAAKVATARTLWVPAVNNHGAFGRWSFIEVSDPWNTANVIRAHVSGPHPQPLSQF
jgi:type III restriction enzyme